MITSDHLQFSITRYLNARTITHPNFSPDGAWIYFLTDITGIPQVWRVGIEHPQSAWAEQLTFDEDRVTWMTTSFTAEEQRILYTRDAGGNENMQIYLLNPETGEDICLTAGYENAMHIPGKWSDNGKKLLFAANRRNPGLFDLYVMEINGETRMIWQNETPGYLNEAQFSPNEKTVLCVRIVGSVENEILEINLKDNTARRVSPLGDAAYHGLIGAKNQPNLYLLTNYQSEYDYIGKLDPANERLDTMMGHQWDVEGLTLSPDGRHLAYSVNTHGASELYVYDLQGGQRHRFPRTGDAPGVIEAITFSPDSQKVAFVMTAANHTHNIYQWHFNTEDVIPLTNSAHGGIPVDTFAVPELIHYPTFDNQADGTPRQIPAWLYRPKNTDGKPAPVIVYVHGGPESQFRPNFMPTLQYFINQGYAVLAPNVRGSTGYGKSYALLDNVEKRMDSVADLAHAAYWVKNQPDLDGNHIIVFGRSYGGFMVLSAVTTYPDLWKAGVEFVGISNWATFLENTSGYRRTHREKEYGSLAQNRKFLERISPIYYVDQIGVPMFIQHGANDPRVPLSETRQMVDAIKSLGIRVEFVVFEDEGHGIVKLKNKLVVYEAMAKFLASLK